MRANLRDLLSRSRVADDGGDPFDARLLTRIDRMRLRIRRAHGARAGDTLVRGLTQDSGIEVEGFKTYAPGDDIRYVDWNAAARIDQLLTRRFVAEREIPVHLLLDASASMAAPAGDAKFFFARKLVAALAYISLNNNDPVRVTALAGAAAGGPASSPMLRHRGRYLRLRPVLTSLRAEGPTELLAGVSGYLERHRERGIAILVSDFLVSPAEYEEALSRLAARKLEVQAIQVVGPGEDDLSAWQGRLRLRDVETGVVREVALDGAQRRRYREAFERRTEAIRIFCHARGIVHAVARAEDEIEHCLTEVLSRSGMLKLR